MCTYNGEPYIIEQLESIRMQSLTPDEVLIFDDISNDNTVEIIREFILKYHLEKSWHLYQNRKNKGWKKNFIDGMSVAKGDFIFPCDQDDIWESNKLEVLSNIIKKNSKINVLTTNCKAFYDNGKIVVRPEPENGELIQQYLVTNFFGIRYPGCTYCIRNSYFKKIFNYWQEDFPHDAFLYRFSMFDGSLYSLNTSLIKWRRHKDSTYSKESLESKTLQNKINWIDYANRFITSIENYLKNESIEYEINWNILKDSRNWLKARKQFLITKNPINGIRLAKYIQYYPKKRQYLGDWYLFFSDRT